MQCRTLSAQTKRIIAYFGEKSKSFFEKTYFFRVEPKKEAVKPHIATDLHNGLRLAPVNDDFVCSIPYLCGNVNIHAKSFWLFRTTVSARQPFGRCGNGWRTLFQFTPPRGGRQQKRTTYPSISLSFLPYLSSSPGDLTPNRPARPQIKEDQVKFPAPTSRGLSVWEGSARCHQIKSGSPASMGEVFPKTSILLR